MHHGRLARLVARDLGPELLGLEEHLAHPLVGSERFEGMQVEHLCHTVDGGDRCLVVHDGPPAGIVASVADRRWSDRRPSRGILPAPAALTTDREAMNNV